MRAIWSGSISFGLVNIPIKLYSATEETMLSFNMLHEKDMSPIQYARICKMEKSEVPYDEIIKGYEYSEGNFVILTDEDFENANIRITKTITILDFVNKNEIDTKYFEKPYYLEPDKNSAKPYTLLREALKKTGKVGIGRYVLRNRERLVALEADENLLFIDHLRFQSEMRDKTGLKLPESKSEEPELEMAINLINQMSKKFNPSLYKDTYTNELRRIIDEKVSGKTPSRKGTIPKPTPVPDLMEMLKKSLESEKVKSRNES